MASVISHVDTQFTRANQYVQSAQANAQEFLERLNDATQGLAIPQIDLPITLPPMPEVTLEAESPSLVSIDMREVAPPVDDTGLAPATDTNIGSAPGAPTLIPTDVEAVGRAIRDAIGDAPDFPELREITFDEEVPELTQLAAPALLSISVPTFGGIDDHRDLLPDAPEALVLIPPRGYEYNPPAPYSSELLAAVAASLRQRLQGGTGLNPEVEALLFERGRSRETLIYNTAMQEVMRNAEQRGFALPPGAIAAQLQEAQRNYYAKLSEYSRDVTMKQAELEQANLKHALEQGIALEGQLIRYANDIEQRAFEAERTLAANAVEVYNAQVAKYRTVVETYNTMAQVFRAAMEGEVAKVQAYKSMVEAEQAKAEVNKAMVETYRTQLQAHAQVLEVYKLRIDAAQAQLGFERFKLEAFGEELKAYVAKTNIETLKLEAAKTNIMAQGAQVDLYGKQVDAWSTQANATLEAARTAMAGYVAKTQAYAAKISGYNARVGAEAERVRALATVNDAELRRVGMGLETGKAQAEVAVEGYRAALSAYEAQKSVAFQQSKLLSDNYMAIRNIVAEASKAGAQVYAQLTASAYGTIQANAQLSGSLSGNASWSYSGKTSDEQAAPVLV